ncbi:MAG TPA: antibiotic biosynthesis monooxygenase [Gemmatimonadaceae bacterium]|nr:antibiotic biosynthesis monooxygenase [Gemmatimonadaceae bacterium]
MHARTVMFHVTPGKAEDGIRVYQDSVLPAAAKQPGFRGGMMLVNRAENTALSITLWDSEADLVRSESSGYYGQQIQKIEPLLSAPPERTVYEVGPQTMMQPPSPMGAERERAMERGSDREMRP